MSKKTEDRGRKTEVSVDELLTKAGFQTLEKPNKRIIHASGTADFGKSHAAFLKAAGKHPALIGCSAFPTATGTILLVRRNISRKAAEPQSTEGKK